MFDFLLGVEDVPDGVGVAEVGETWPCQFTALDYGSLDTRGTRDERRETRDQRRKAKDERRAVNFRNHGVSYHCSLQHDRLLSLVLAIIMQGIFIARCLIQGEAENLDDPPRLLSAACMVRHSALHANGR